MLSEHSVFVISGFHSFRIKVLAQQKIVTLFSGPLMTFTFKGVVSLLRRDVLYRFDLFLLVGIVAKAINHL